MTYREWIMENWEHGEEYRNKLAYVARLESKIQVLRAQIAQVENGETPDHTWFRDAKNFAWSSMLSDINDSFMAHFLGKTPEEYLADRWERDALEANKRLKEKKASFLTMYRDGNLFPGLEEPDPGSLPDLESDLTLARLAVQKSAPHPPFDWSKNPYNRDWYEPSIKVLNSMLSTLGRKPDYDFDLSFAEFVHHLTTFHHFRFALWTSWGATCKIAHYDIPKKNIVRRRDTMWAAALWALLDFIDIHWDVLYENRHRSVKYDT